MTGQPEQPSVEQQTPAPAGDPSSQPPTGAEPTTDSTTLDGSLSGARAWFAEHGLVRPRRGKMIGGVCAALGRRYGVNVLVMRVLFVVAALAGVPVLLYVALWVLMPREP
jgi:phage shock protein C